MKYRDWLYEWLENFVKPNVKENTYCKYIRQSGAYIVPALGDCPLGGITALILQKFVAGLNARGLSPATVNGLITLLKGSLKKLGIPHRGFHSLRHTFATRALEVGMDVRTLSEILGHNNPAITLKRYAHSLMEHKVQMMNRLGRLFEDKTKNRQLRALPAMYME